MTSYSAWNDQTARAIISAKRSIPGALLPILHDLQAEFGYIAHGGESLIAEILNLSRAEVHGVLTFYHDFRRAPPSRHVLKLCRAEACQSVGGDELAMRAQDKVGAKIGDAAGAGGVALEPVYCLGLCAVAPAAMLDGLPVGRLDETKLDALLAGLER